jgi:TRAP-type C4-dicarboxylate transport system permease small subunit
MLAATPPIPPITPVAPTGSETVTSILSTIIGWFLLVAGAIAVIYLIWAGYTYITSAGDPEKATKARNSILYAAIGIVVIVLSYVIVNTVAKEAGKAPTQNQNSSQQQQQQNQTPGGGRFPVQ